MEVQEEKGECFASELLVNAVPKHLQWINFADLHFSVDSSKSVFLGKVSEIDEIILGDHCFSMDLLLAENITKADKCGRMLRLSICSGDLTQLKTITEKNLIAVTGFEVKEIVCNEICNERFLPLQVVVRINPPDSSNSAVMWIAKPVSSVADTTPFPYTHYDLFSSEYSCSDFDDSMREGDSQINYIRMIKHVSQLRKKLDLEFEAVANKQDAEAVISTVNQLEKSIAAYKSEYDRLVIEAQSIKAGLASAEAKVAEILILSNRDEEAISDHDEHVRLFPVKESDLIVVVMSHPSTVTLNGLACIQVIRGSVKINGCILKQHHKPIHVFASRKIMPLDIRTEECKDQVSGNEILLLQKHMPKDMAETLISSCINTSTIVLLMKKNKVADVDFATSLLPDAFSLDHVFFEEDDIKHWNFDLYFKKSPSADYAQVDELLANVISKIKDHGESKLPASRILIQECSKGGKSAVLRYMINVILNEFRTVYYLEGDPSLPEFSPPGSLSIVKVTQPLLGPSFSHQVTPEKMVFLGNVDAALVPMKYDLCMKYLCNCIEEKYSDAPLLINTPSGEPQCVINLKKLLSPNYVIEIIPKLSNIYEVQYDSLDTKSWEKFVLQGFYSVDQDSQVITDKYCRDLSLLAYLGQCEDAVYLFHSSLRHNLSDENVTKIFWKDIVMYMEGLYSLDNDQLFSMLQGGYWMALLSVSESVISGCDNAKKPRLLPTDPVAQTCYGFGFLYHFDLSKEVFYILTPVPERIIKEEVNCLVGGNIYVPEMLYTYQENIPCVDY